MTQRLSSRRLILGFLFAAALPASSQPVIYEPVRMPASVLTAPMVGTRLGALTAPTFHATLTQSLAAPLISPSLVPQVKVSIAPTPTIAAPDMAVPVLPQGWVFNQNGIIIPTGKAVSASGASIELGKAVSQRNAPVSQIFTSFYDGASRSVSAVDASAGGSESASGSGYLSETKGLAGQALLSSLHQITGRGYQSHDYKESSKYMFSTADNVTVHGTRGVVDAYSGIFVPGSSNYGGDYSEHGDQDGDGYPERDGMNVEHTWPQSFFDKALPMRSDLHHLLPTFQHPNSMRSNLPFGEVKGQPDYSNNGGAKEGGGIFEPPDVSKGRVARAVLYFYTRYYDRNITQGAYNHGFFKDRIDMFLRWNREHPPTADELRRNDLVEKYQGNRNPFTDDYALADRIGTEGFTGASPVRSDLVSQRPAPQDRPQVPDRRHGRHHNGRGNDFRVAAPGRLSPLDFILH